MYKLVCSECLVTQRRKTYDDGYKCIQYGCIQTPLLVTQELIKSTRVLLSLVSS